MQVLYHNGAVTVQPVKYYPELERSVKMIADSEEKLANSFLSLHPQTNPCDGLTQYFKNRDWAITAETV